MSELEDRLLFYLRALGVPEPEREYKFCPNRRFRFDLCWPAYKVAVEAEGAIWVAGRHTRGSGFERDCNKYNLAAILGWTVIRVTSGMIEDGRATDYAIAALHEKGAIGAIE